MNASLVKIRILLILILSFSFAGCKEGIIVETTTETDPGTGTSTPASFQLSITINGSGSVSDGSQQCSTSCLLTYPEGTAVTLTATSNNGTVLGWGGACAGNGNCSLTMTADMAATATFDSTASNSFTLTVMPPNNGSVTATGISCGSDCSESLPENSQLSLTPSPASGYQFSNWTGACSGSGSCNITMNSDKTVSAQFSPVQVVDSSDCAQNSVHCVDASGTKEYTDIQAAIGAANRTDTVLVFPGTYRGFNVNKSGTSSSSHFVVKAAANGVTVNRHGDASDAIIKITNASHVTVEGFTVNNTDGTSYGFAARGANGSNPMQDLIVRNNKVFDSPSTNMYLSQVSDSLIEGNETAGSAGSHGIYLSNGGSDNTTLRNNITYQNGKNGIHFNGDATVSGDGLHTGLIIEGNTIYANTGNGLDMDGVKDSLIQNNLIYENNRHAIRGFKIDSAEGTGGLTIINNTCADNGGWSVKLTDDDGDNIIFNNVFLDNGGSISVNSGNLQTGYNVTNNVFRVSSNSEGPTVDLANWQSFGYGDSSTTSSGSSVFTNASADNYTLRTGSAAANGGVARFANSSAPITDIEGNSRPSSGSHDMGAFENF